ncbi:MAG TPA: phage holin family protein [Candidatus Paceibacterota bacterium]
MTLIHWITSVVGILIAAYLLPGVDATLLGAIVLAVVLGIINLFVKPVLALLTLPLTLITLGLFSLVLNALLIMLAAMIVPGFAISGFWAAFFFGIVLALVNAVFGVARR